MKNLVSKFLLAVLATGTLVAGAQTAASARDMFCDTGCGYSGYTPIYSGYTYGPTFDSGFYRDGWRWTTSPYTLNSGYWHSGNDLELGARSLLHGLVDEIF